MTVAELIERLKAMPQDARVMQIWDGDARGDIHHVYLARGGKVMLVDEDEHVYEDEDRPLDAPTTDFNRYWTTPRSAETIARADAIYGHLATRAKE